MMNSAININREKWCIRLTQLMRALKRCALAAFIVVVISTFSQAQNQDQCAPLDGPAISKILHGAAKLFRTDPLIPSIDKQEPVEGTCYWRLWLSIPNSSRQLSVFVSPDRRFLSPTLWDIESDPNLADVQLSEDLKQKASGDGIPAIGPEDAPVTVVTFSDFQCPYCAAFAEMLSNYRKEHPGQIRLLFRNAPLAKHSWATDAAYSGICISKQSGEAFWSFTDFVFGQQKNLTTENIGRRLEDWVRGQARLRPEVYRECMAGDHPKEQLKRDLTEANKLNVHGTPTLFVNGARYGGFRDERALAVAINRAMRVQKVEKAGGQ